MQCPRCQTENPPQAKFCLECASPLARACPNCSTQLPPSAKFCPECAHPVAANGLTASQPRFVSPQTYTPKHLAEKILLSKGDLSAAAGELPSGVPPRSLPLSDPRTTNHPRGPAAAPGR